ncbi:MAG: hypothetical protein JKX73_03730 [Flavobacteriales bacterium]|nr:hypothetical protein [Flavobacteriales bacterium]
MLDYSELEKPDIRLPHTYEYSNDSKSIFVYGSYHTSDPRDSIIADIESTIANFKPDLILYEGDGISFENTKEKSIEYYFEMGLVRYLCNEKRIPDMNLEPPTKDKYQDVLQRHSAPEVFLATVGSQITLLLVSGRSVEFGKFYGQLVSDLQQEGYPITDDEKDVNYFYKIYEGFYGIPFDLNTFDYETVEIKFNKTKLNQINQESAHFRDLYMLRIIEDQLSEYDRIYIQIGGRHGIVWEPAIKEIIKKERLPTIN